MDLTEQKEVNTMITVHIFHVSLTNSRKES